MLVDKPGQLVPKGVSGRSELTGNFGDLRRQGHQLLSDGFGKGPEEFGDLSLAQAWHGPFNRCLRKSLGQMQIDFDSYSVVVLTRPVGVRKRKRLASECDGVRERCGVVMQHFATDHIGFSYAKKIRLLLQAQEAV